MDFRVSDHAALLINFHTESPHPSTPQEYRGFHMDTTKKEDWSNTFRSLITDHSVLTSSDPAEASGILHDIIMTACQRHLDKIKPGPPKGAVWWNDDCSAKLHLLRSSTVGEKRKTASRIFRSTVREAKQSWAHQQLFENADNTISGTWLASAKDDGHRYCLH
jgi:hypothetical protein